MDSPTTHTDSISEANSQNTADFSALLLVNRGYLQYTLSGDMPNLDDAETKRDMTAEQVLAIELVQHSADQLRIELFLKAKERSISERELTLLLLEPIADLMRSTPAGGD